MDDFKPGSPETGGLTFEPPQSPGETQPELGFAPDLLDQHAVLESVETHSIQHDSQARVDYPISLSTLLGLLSQRDLLQRDNQGQPPPSIEPSTSNDPSETESPAPLEDFEIGPPITRAPAHIAKPPATEDEMQTAAPNTSIMHQANSLIDMALVGSDEDDRQEVHLIFKEDVFEGVHLRMVTTPDGLEVIFMVQDAYSRRQLEGRVDDLMARLSQKGLRIVSHRIETAAAE